MDPVRGPSKLSGEFGWQHSALLSNDGRDGVGKAVPGRLHWRHVPRLRHRERVGQQVDVAVDRLLGGVEVPEGPGDGPHPLQALLAARVLQGRVVAAQVGRPQGQPAQA